MINKLIFKEVISLIFLILLFFPSTDLSAQSRPNIIIILCDDAGYQDLGAFGGIDVHTPNIDQLAKNGVQFSNAYATASVCAPSRAGLLTGKYQQRFGFDHNTSSLPRDRYTLNDIGLDTSIHTIADHLKYNGYQTIAIGKWHLGKHKKYFPLNRGFINFYGIIGGHRSYYSMDSAQYTAETRMYRDTNLVDEKEITYLTDDLTHEAVRYIDKNSNNPFFIYLSYTAVHTPMHAKSKTLEKYSHINDPLRRNYLAMYEDMDVGVGKIIEQLKKNNLYENTVIFFLSDNGAATNNGANNGFLRGLKGSKWDGGIRVPMIIQWPSQLPSNQHSKTIVSTMDILPTCMDIVNGNTLSDQVIDGRSILKTYNKPNSGHEYLFWRRGIAKAVRNKKWKLIQVADNPILLFDLEKDPSESTNVAVHNQKIVNKLLDQLQNWEDKMQSPKWNSSFADQNANQIMKHKMEVIGRTMEKLYP